MDASHSTREEPSKQSDAATTNEIFTKVLMNDRIQNKNLTSKLSKGYDVEKGAGSKNTRASKTRFFVCTLGLISLAMAQMSRTVINVVITSMVDPSMQKSSESVSSDGSCPWPEEQAPITEICSTDLSTEPSIVTTTVSYDTTTQVTSNRMWDVETTTTNMLINQPFAKVNETHFDDNLEASNPPTYKWTMKQQSVLLGAFFYSYFFFMILGGRISEIYGSKYVLMLGVAGSSLISLAIPWIAAQNFYLLVFARIIMGCIQSGVFPAMYALISKWLTMSEASIYAPLIKMNLRLGMLLSSAVPGLVADWRHVFYLTGFLGIVWSVLWFFIATSDPKDNRWVNELELGHIIKKKKKKPTPEEEKPAGLELTDRSKQQVEEQKPKKKASLKTPWLNILTNSSVIGLVIVKITFNCGIDFLTIEVPSYLKYVHHASREQISAITTGLFSIQVALVIFVGWFAKIMVQKKPFGLNKTGTRIFFQTLSSGGVGLSLFLLSFNDCSLIYTAILLQFMSFFGMFTAGGETMLPYDLSEEYPATIMAIANSVANTSGICVTLLAGAILGEQGGSFSRWNILIYLLAGTITFGAVMFAILIKAEPVDFNAKKVKVPSAPVETDEDDASKPTHKSYKVDEDVVAT